MMPSPWSPSWFVPFDADDIRNKPVPKWPHRASYRKQVRDARRRRNVAKRRGAG